MCYLESAEVAAILSQPDQSTAEGQRDHTLLSVLYNTGARIQEALDLRPQDIHLKSPTHVRLLGKGRKERISPLWPETAEVIAALLRRSPRRADEPLFVNRYGEPLTASGFRFRLRQYVKAAAQHVPTLSRKRITPHIFRHTTAVHLVAAGRRRYRDSKLDGSRPTGHDQPLRASQPGDEAEGARTGRPEVAAERSRRDGSGTLICWPGSIRCDGRLEMIQLPATFLSFGKRVPDLLRFHPQTSLWMACT